MVTRGRISGAQGGFTLLEMLIVMCIIITLYIALVPQVRPILVKKDQMQALNECKAISDALMYYTVLRGGNAGADNPVDMATYPFSLTHSDQVTLLSPDFLHFVPELDPWGTVWEVSVFDTFDPTGAPAPNFDVSGPRVFVVRSLGQNQVADSSVYSPGPFALNQDSLAMDPLGDDVVCADGTVIRWPGKWNVN